MLDPWTPGPADPCTPVGPDGFDIVVSLSCWSMPADLGLHMMKCPFHPDIALQAQYGSSAAGGDIDTSRGAGAKPPRARTGSLSFF